MVKYCTKSSSASYHGQWQRYPRGRICPRQTSSGSTNAVVELKVRLPGLSHLLLEPLPFLLFFFVLSLSLSLFFPSPSLPGRLCRSWGHLRFFIFPFPGLSSFPSPPSLVFHLVPSSLAPAHAVSFFSFMSFLCSCPVVLTLFFSCAHFCPDLSLCTYARAFSPN